jgi:hypothetical protein
MTPIIRNGKQQIVAAFNRFYKQHRRERQEDTTRENNKGRRELYTLIGIWVYTVITAGIAGISLYQAHIFKETEQRQLRAYVATSPLLITCCDEADPRKDIMKILMENAGQTPAYFLDGFLKRFQFSMDDTFPEGFECRATGATDILREKERHGAIVNPKLSYSPVFAIPQDLKKQILETRAGKNWMVFCGELLYRDIFNYEYAQKFCFEYKYPIVAPEEMSFCPEYNQEEITDYIAEARKRRQQRTSILLPGVPHYDEFLQPH